MICFAAHPDDETIGAGGQLAWWRDVWVVHATDGAPRNMEDARRHGFTARECYALARRREVLEALHLAGIGPERALTLNIADQECCRALPDLVRRVTAIIRDLRPETALAPPYEGGHPDHDSLAFAVHIACRILAREGDRPPTIIEHALYHGAGGDFQAGEFLPEPSVETLTLRLGAGAEARKKQMLGCFRTQRAVLAPFPTSVERFRMAPHYDFRQPPHAGRLYYEHFNWGVDGAEWRDLAEAAERELGWNRG